MHVSKLSEFIQSDVPSNTLLPIPNKFGTVFELGVQRLEKLEKLEIKFKLTDVLPCCILKGLFQQQRKRPRIKSTAKSLCISEVHRSSLHGYAFYSNFRILWSKVNSSWQDSVDRRQDRKIQPTPGTNQIVAFAGYHSLALPEKSFWFYFVPVRNPEKSRALIGCCPLQFFTIRTAHVSITIEELTLLQRMRKF